jgi:ABC-type sugar transport system substrate-binding protein
MFRKITVLAAALATTATLAVAAGPANAARSMDYSGQDTTFSAQPTHTHTMDSPGHSYQTGDESEYCTKALDAANSWMREAWNAWFDDDQAASEQAERNADAIAGDANANGCNLNQPE